MLKRITFLSGALISLHISLLTPAFGAVQGITQKVREAGLEMVRGNFERSVVLYNDALAEKDLANEQRATILNDRGVAQWRMRQALAAIDDFNQAVALYPEYAATYNNRGNVLMGIGMLDEAIKDFDRAVLLSPKYSAAFSNRATAYARLEKFDEAAWDYTQAIRLAPSSPVPYNGRGLSHLKASRPLSAVRDFSRTLSIDPKFIAGFKNRARVHMLLGRQDKAISDLSRAQSLSPEDAQLYLSRARAWIALQKPKSAIKDLNKAVELKPDFAVAYGERGLALGMLNAHEDALADFGRAIDLNPQIADVYANRAWTYENMGNSGSALPDVARALKIDPRNVRALEIRARAHEVGNRPQASISDYRKIVSLRPNYDKAWIALERLAGETRPLPRRVSTSDYSDWMVLQLNDGRYIAQSTKDHRLRVPLETYGKAEPRLLDWEQKRNEFKGIGILRFNAGQISGQSGPEEVEYAAVVDARKRQLVSIEPYRIGQRRSVWTWERGKLIVSGADGVTSEYQLRRPRNRSTGNAVAGSPFAGQGYWGENGRRIYKSRKVKKRRRRKRSLFEMLFN